MKHAVRGTTLGIVLLALAVASGGVVVADPPDESGVVIRSEGQFWYCHVDFNSGLWAYYGISNVGEWCEDPGINEYVELSDIHQVFVGADPDVIVDLEKGNDLTSGVYAIEGGTWCDCTAPNLDSPLATGTVDLIYTDNSLFGAGTRTNTWGWRAHGALDTPTGGRAMYNGAWHATFGAQQGVASFFSRVRLGNSSGNSTLVKDPDAADGGFQELEQN